MPPSPALKCSPGRELRGENHKRGRSFESGILFRENDDDLALFNEMQTKEKESFLLQSSNDFEDTFSTKLRLFSDFKLGITIPVRGESNELLNANGEKNDYDWLLTPPDSPLFPSLDDDSALVNVPRKGRPRSQPISISRSSTMEKSYRSSRGSPSPNRLSPSPRSGNSSFQSMRGRPSSAPQYSPPAPRSTTPIRRPSPPPSKSCTPVPRSYTPTPRRMSTGSRGTAAPSSARGTSPITASRGNSASPKIRAWQSNIPGFSLEAPPNLRTSLADRPASYVRGSSPASRNARNSTSKFGRQSMSPTTRSINSSNSHDRDRFSSQSKGSVASSGDDDMDSVQSIPIGGSDNPLSKRAGASPNNRAPTFSKKSARIISSSSAPKRPSFDSALRQMDNRRSPQDMFRPLLSSVPSSTFLAGKSSSNHRFFISRNSSVTTSSNASSDQGTSVAHETEGSEHLPDDLTSDFRKVHYPGVHEEVFSFEKVDPLDEEVGYERHDKSFNLQLRSLDMEPHIKCSSDAFTEVNNRGVDVTLDPTSKALSTVTGSSEVSSSESTKPCSQCGLRYPVIETVEMDMNLCPDCRQIDIGGTVTNAGTTVVAAENSSVFSLKISEDNKSFDDFKPPLIIPELLSQVSDVVEPMASEAEENVVQSQTLNSDRSLNCSEQISIASKGGEVSLSYPQETDQCDVGHDLSSRDTEGQQLKLSSDHSDIKVYTSEGAGISLLLNRSNSIKGPVVQGRTLTATIIPYEDLPYARDISSSWRSSTHGSGSTSSSIDFSSSRLSETRVQRQLSGRKSDMENNRHDLNTKSPSTGSPLTGSSNHTHQAFGLPRSTHEISEASLDDTKIDAEGLSVTSQTEMLVSEYIEAGITHMPVTDAAALEEGTFERNESSKTTDASTSEISSHAASVQSDEKSVAFLQNCEEHSLYENGEDIPTIAISASDVEASITSPESSYEPDSILDNGRDVMDHEEPTHIGLATIKETEIENNCQSPFSSQMGEASPRSTSITNELQEPSVPTSSDKDVKTVHDISTTDCAHGSLEESTVLVESCGGSKARRSLTLEEATDAILFCSSIAHDIAYQAASIAMEKEISLPLEDSRPTVTILGKSNTDRKNQHGRAVGKQTSKSQKVRQRQVETNEKPPNSENENDENADESMIRNVGLPTKVETLKPPKLESKCNCTIM